ncbi:hypothetical protein Isop_3756 (plasmid) [Isosphaera pallida ATCC 43644]|uniref:Uncharacterized protein n=1 Tax=Isosphaera pallida (strain ATCC 43644 / DSM 9630 / IS1B) TaxID=575540 RepID=E8R6W9_ISOPI|nr:hypothetical protein Isop_3756 [Isosphaera pallida ATCC 43644]
MPARQNPPYQTQTRFATTIPSLPPPPNRPPQNGQGVKGRSRHMDRLAEPGHPTLYALQPSQSFPPARLTTIFGGGMGVGFP